MGIFPPAPATRAVDIVFVNPTHHGSDYYAPIGIGILSTLLEQAGYRVATLDFHREAITGAIPWPENFLSAAAQRISAIPAPIYAFSVMNVGLPWAVRLAEAVRAAHPDTCIVFGGPHPSLMGRELLEEYPQIDVVARREGELIIVPLVAALLARDHEALGHVSNLLLRDGDRILDTATAPLMPDLDAIPLLPLDATVLSEVDIISVEAGRGCPYHCSFCSSHSIWTRKPRFKSPRRLVDEAVRYVDGAGSRPEPLVISFEHDDFLSNRPWFTEFIAYKRASGADFRYGITARVNHITPAVAEALSQSGCVSVFMGLETGSEQLQSSSMKHLRVADVLPRVQRLIGLGIHVSCNFIVGFPDETWNDLYHSFELMLRIRWLGGDVNISVMCPEPGSALYAATPAAAHVVLSEGVRVDEMRRGGIELADLKRPERMHITTIASPQFDIVSIARFAMLMQHFLADYPVTLGLLRDAHAGHTPSLIAALYATQQRYGRIESGHIFEALSPMLKSAPSVDLFLYEHAKAVLKATGTIIVPAGCFTPDMPAKYQIALAGYTPRDVPASWVPDHIIPIRESA